MSLKSKLISKSVKRVLERDLPSILSIMNNIASPRKIAKKIINDVNRELSFKPKIGTVAKVIERYVNDVKRTGNFSGFNLDDVKKVISKTHLLVQSDIAVICIKLSSDTGEKLVKIVDYVNSREEKPLINISLGHSYATIIVDQCNLNGIIKIVGRKNIAYYQKDQAILSIISPKDVLDIPGMSAYFFNLIGLGGINVSEILSSYNEGIIVLKEKDAGEAYKILKNEINRLRVYFKDEE
jgi:hypothetical protein